MLSGVACGFDHCQDRTGYFESSDARLRHLSTRLWPDQRRFVENSESKHFGVGVSRGRACPIRDLAR